MAAPEFLTSLVAPWADLYGDSTLLSTLVTCAHVGGLLYAGGLAIAADRATLAATDDSARSAQLAQLGRLHRFVIRGLILVVVSGALMLASDLDEFFGSPLYWTKMAAVVALLVNGARMRRAGARACSRKFPAGVA